MLPPRPRRPRGPPRSRREDIPAPIGINAVDPGSGRGPQWATYIVNAVSGGLGLAPRPGTAEFATTIGTLQPAEVRSLLAYHSVTGATDKLFAVTHNGIYDVSAGGTFGAAAPVVAFGTDSSVSGRGTAIAVTGKTSGNRHLLYCDEANGYYLYTDGAGWAAGSVNGVAPSALTFVVHWKNRVWFVERDTTHAHYLGLDAVSGQATEFDFGALFPHGGKLLGLYTWTIDGGNGPDDFLVAVSSSGDVVLFRGTDPVASDFGQLGSWFLGGFPAGRRVGVQFGGDMLLLTLQGVISLQKLVSGQLVSPNVYETRNIRPLVVTAMQTQRNLYGWELAIHPQGNFLLINTPGVSGLPQEQFAMSFATQGWSRFQGLDIVSTAVWQGEFYFGTRDGRVMHLSPALFVDEIKLGGDTTQVRNIPAYFLGAYFLGSPGVLKKPHILKVHFLHHGILPTVFGFAKYEFSLEEPETPIVSAPAVSVGSFVWDESNWDEREWSILQGLPATVVGGLAGVGHDFAVGAYFYARDYCVLANIEATWEEGGDL